MNRLRAATDFIDFSTIRIRQLVETLDLLTPCDASADGADDRRL
jgi:hypothetical protein